MSVSNISSGLPGQSSMAVEVGVTVLAKSLELQKQAVEMLDRILEQIPTNEAPTDSTTGQIDLLA